MQCFPVRQQFLLVQLRPRQHESLLTSRQETSQSFDLSNIVNPDVLLIVRVKVGHVMLSARFDEHADDNPKEPRNLWH